MSTVPQVACVEIGNIPISVATRDPLFFDLLSQRYAGFLSNSRPEFALEFEIIDSASCSDDDVSVRLDRAEWRIERGDFRARWDPASGSGLVRQNANPYSLDSVLRILHSLILAERGGFLLHAASAICAGRACLFSGVSGAGKTTMTRLAPPNVTLLSDEISYVRPNAGGYQAFGTPFSGELAKPGENTSAAISTLFFLEKGPENRIEEMPSIEAIGRLMRNILFFANDPKLVERVFAHACEFVARVPIRRLTFYPDGRVWEEVRDFIQRHAQTDAAGEGAVGRAEVKEAVPAHV
jgi:hypothetical protein